MEPEKKRRKVAFGLDPEQEKKQQIKDKQEEIHLKHLEKRNEERKLEEEEEENGGVVERGEHPLGIQPLGNWLLASSEGARNGRDVGLGRMCCLPDSLVLEVLHFLDAKDMAKLCEVGFLFVFIGFGFVLVLVLVLVWFLG